jgi:hypothetical protein
MTASTFVGIMSHFSAIVTLDVTLIFLSATVVAVGAPVVTIVVVRVGFI